MGAFPERSCSMCIQSSWRFEEGSKSPGTSVSDGREPPCERWGPRSSVGAASVLRAPVWLLLSRILLCSPGWPWLTTILLPQPLLITGYTPHTALFLAAILLYGYGHCLQERTCTVCVLGTHGVQKRASASLVPEL